MLRRLGLGLLVIVMAGCSSVEAERTAAPTSSAPPPSSTPAASESRTAPPSPSASASAGAEGRGDVAATLAGMSVEEKVGQLFMPVVYGSRADSEHRENTARFGVGTPAEAIEKYHPGGVIIFPWAGNVSDAKQLAALTTGLRRASGKVPLMIGVDQEHGIVSPLGSIVTKLPGAMAIGSTGDPANAREAARLTGTELRALGITMDFAPVADVNINPRNPVIGPRAFGSDPARVATMVGAAVDGFHAAGIASTAKHFPGHGDTSTDSHTGLPVIQHSKAQWRRLDAPPFREAIEHGIDAIMTAHVVMPKLDPSGDPATLSRTILTGLLRDELGFEGVISTDALNMAGVREKYGDAEVAVRAVLAGADVLLMPPDMPKAYGAVLSAVKSGRISAARLDASVTRILRLKAKRGMFGTVTTNPGLVRSPAHLKTARRIAGEAGVS
ncbi:glycoside hydrolase family 3 protein [Microtetraspora sp. AC03309]|uniref:glycoside hydrolase family 3 protein n=1 Tax=Microtetraspora sp. AC03309 TaxID=2779376 RepID=UPI001E6266D4|nr:glycoside hydrolase family 3 protein [Microtetraspora sp. AC03309]